MVGTMQYEYEEIPDELFSTDEYAEIDGYIIEENYYTRRVRKEDRRRYSPKALETSTVIIYVDPKERIPSRNQIIEAGFKGNKIVDVRISKGESPVQDVYRYEPVYTEVIPLKKREVIRTPTGRRKKKGEPEIWKWNTKEQRWEFVEFAKNRKKKKKLVSFKGKKIKEGSEGKLGYVEVTYIDNVQTKRFETFIILYYILDYEESVRNPERHIGTRLKIRVIVGFKPEKGKELEWINKLQDEIESYFTVEQCNELIGRLHPNLENSDGGFIASVEMEGLSTEDIGD